MFHIIYHNVRHRYNIHEILISEMLLLAVPGMQGGGRGIIYNEMFEQFLSSKQVMNISRKNHEQVMNKLWTS